MRYVHCEKLKAKHDIEFVNPVTNRKNRIKKDTIVWVTCVGSETISIAKIGQNSGYSLDWTIADVGLHFERIDMAYVERMIQR